MRTGEGFCFAWKLEGVHFFFALALSAFWKSVGVEIVFAWALSAFWKSAVVVAITVEFVVDVEPCTVNLLAIAVRNNPHLWCRCIQTTKSTTAAAVVHLPIIHQS